MGKNVGVVNVFAKPYEVWSKRDATPEEMWDLIKNHGLTPPEVLHVKDLLIEVVSNHTDAAIRMLRQCHDNSLECHIDRALEASAEYRALRDLMPQAVPEALNAYQGAFSEDDWASADAAIKAYGVTLAEGQFLYHGGQWASDGPTLTTSRPFSTSFCPQVALKNAEWRGKAYDAGRVDLMVVRVTRSRTKAYAYSREGDHGNEKEVVFASGAQLTRVRETKITDFPVSKATASFQTDRKVVPAYLVEVEIC